jgi:hypothetical protein
MVTKWYREKNRGRPDDDIPVSVTGYENDHRGDQWCPHCRHKLIRIRDYSGLNDNYYCNNCSIGYPKEETKSQSYLGTPAKSNNDSPAVAYPPEPGLRRKKNEPRGTFKVLRDRGMNMVNYKETGWRKETYD